MKSVEQKYRKLSDIEHVLLRPGMYCGSIKPREDSVYLLNEEGRFALRNVTYNPELLKIFDEIVSNAVDEHRRNPKLNEVRVTVDSAAAGQFHAACLGRPGAGSAASVGADGIPADRQGLPADCRNRRDGTGDCAERRSDQTDCNGRDASG